MPHFSKLILCKLQVSLQQSVPSSFLCAWLLIILPKTVFTWLLKNPRLCCFESLKNRNFKERFILPAHHPLFSRTWGQRGAVWCLDSSCTSLVSFRWAWGLYLTWNHIGLIRSLPCLTSLDPRLFSTGCASLAMHTLWTLFPSAALRNLRHCLCSSIPS